MCLFVRVCVCVFVRVPAFRLLSGRRRHPLILYRLDGALCFKYRSESLCCILAEIISYCINNSICYHLHSL